jgi:hypothetical protein
MRKVRIGRRNVVPLVALALVACSGRDRAEAASVLYALERVRAAPKDAKGPSAEILAQLTCSSSSVCAARDRCAEVYRHFAAGMAAQARVLSEIEKLEKEPPSTVAKLAELGADLDRAEAEVNDAQAGLSGCEQAATTMRRKYGI